ncbi:hypothetical protein SRHO_G00209890 [Serrasalmus rhombeus]
MLLKAITIGTMSFKCGILSLIVLLNSPVSGALGETLRMTCSPQTICALQESTVTLECSHSNTTIRPQHSFWFSPKQQAKWRNEEDPEDLALDSDYAGRVRYTNNRYSSILTLTISELRERDSGEYHLMIVTETGQKYSSSTAVTLTVSDLQMMMTSYNEPQTERTLLCSTSCSLSSQPAPTPAPLKAMIKSDPMHCVYLFITDPAEKFTGKPGVILNVTDLQVKVSPTTPSEGQTVTLTCFSTCTLPNNPTYIWYKNRHPVTNKPTKYNKLYLESASTEDVLQYSCAIGALEGPVSPEAPKGSEAPEDAKENSVLKFITVASIFLALIFTTGLMWRWNMIRRKGGAESEARVQRVGDFPNDTYTVLKPTTMSLYYNTLTHLRDSPRDPDTALSPTTLSLDYDNLTHVRSSSGEMYSSLNPTTMVSDYDTLTNVIGSPNNTML